VSNRKEIQGLIGVLGIFDKVTASLTREMRIKTKSPIFANPTVGFKLDEGIVGLAAIAS
jgi:hypothetical protein